MFNKSKKKQKELVLEGVKYLVFDDFQDFAAEVKRSKRAVLRTDYSCVAVQQQELFQMLSSGYGPGSEDCKAIVRSRLCCPDCTAAFTSSFKTKLMMGMRYSNVQVPECCPKCGSKDILYLYDVSSAPTGTNQTNT